MWCYLINGLPPLSGLTFLQMMGDKTWVLHFENCWRYQSEDETIFGDWRVSDPQCRGLSHFTLLRPVLGDQFAATKFERKWSSTDQHSSNKNIPNPILALPLESCISCGLDPSKILKMPPRFFNPCIGLLSLWSALSFSNLGAVLRAITVEVQSLTRSEVFWIFYLSFLSTCGRW